MLSEAEFFVGAAAFLSTIAELPDDPPAPDQNLLETGILDSLKTVEFLAYIEDRRGSPFPPGLLSAASVTTLRSAYRLIVAPPTDHEP